MFKPARMKIILLGCILLLLSFVFADEIHEKVEVQLVQVDLVATDSKGSLVTDLTGADFTLKENGKVQKVSHFYNSSRDESGYPLTISFLVDTSYSMHENVAGLTRIDVAVKAAELIMNQLKPNDQIELIEFNDKPEAIVPFTSNLNSVREKLKTLNFRQANTAMRDAIIFALDRIHGQPGRNVIVIFSDGMDTASKSIEEDVIQAVRKSDATIIAFYSEFATLNFPGGGSGIGMGGSSGPPNRIKIRIGEDALREYAELSGGQFFSFRREPELLQALESFRAFVRSQYTLAYTPPDSNKHSGWRKIKVECKRKGIQLRYREGYWAG
jgi:Ca-activated chloride channel family protein